MRMEALQAREDLMKLKQNFLKKFNRISFRETPKCLMQAWGKFFKVKHAQSEEAQELLNKLLHDVQNIHEELAEYINILSWKRHVVYYDDDDDDEDYTIAITLDSPKTDSLIMVEKHLDTISETKSDEFINSSVENLHDEYISFMERLLYDNSSPRPSEDFHANLNTIIESLPTFPIPVEDSDPFMEEIDLFLASDGSIPSGIDSDNSDSEGDNLFPERLLYDDPIPLPDILDFSNVV
nr:hypothetical protein [Tanacetum cinerariifolium]